jgi:hypothetical protein
MGKNNLYRTDRLSHAMNVGKEAQLQALVTEFRKKAPAVAAQQWRLFFETGRFNAYVDVKHHANPDTGFSATLAQQARQQAKEMLDGWQELMTDAFRRLGGVTGA